MLNEIVGAVRLIPQLVGAGHSIGFGHFYQHVAVSWTLLVKIVQFVGDVRTVEIVVVKHLLKSVRQIFGYFIAAQRCRVVLRLAALARLGLDVWRDYIAPLIAGPY